MPELPTKRLAQNALAAFAVAAGYFACAVIGTLLSVPPSGFAIIWPATAFLISALLIAPPERWWVCLSAVVPTHFLIAAVYQPEAPLAVVLTQVAGNLLLAVATACAVRFTRAKNLRFDSFRSALAFIVVAGVAVPAVVNAAILSLHLATGWTQDLWLSWRQWMIAGLFPTVTIPPVLVLAFAGELLGPRPISAVARYELAAVALLLYALGFGAFGGGMDAEHWPALLLTPFPLLIWAAVRLGVGGACVALLAFAAAIIVHALRQEGPFSAHSPMEDVISLQVFLTAAAIPSVLLAAFMDGRRRAADALQGAEQRMQMVTTATETGLWQWDERTKMLWLTASCQAMLGLPVDSARSLKVLFDAVHPEDRVRFAQALSAASASEGGRDVGEFRVGGPNKTRLLSLYARTEFDAEGEPMCVSGVFTDVTRRRGVQSAAAMAADSRSA